jgi:hypothetical protein
VSPCFALNRLRHILQCGGGGQRQRRGREASGEEEEDEEGEARSEIDRLKHAHHPTTRAMMASLGVDHDEHTRCGTEGVEG